MRIKNLMRKFVFTLVLFFTAVTIGLPLVPAQAQDWMTLGQFKRDVKKNRRAGNYPFSMQCRADSSKKTFRPQISVVWKKNSAQKDWEMYAYKGQLDFKPGLPAQWDEWRRAYRNVLTVGSGGSKFYCSLFYRK